MPTLSFPFDRRSYKPAGRNLMHVSDGDTPNIQMPIRMCNIDTPEKADFAGKAETAQPKLQRALDRLETGEFQTVPTDVVQYFAMRITPDAAARHVEAGSRATQVFQGYLDQRLIREDGKRRKVGVFPQGEAIDFYGRLLAYTAPWYTKTELQDGADRTTFNVNMIESGWAAFFPFYPSLPRDRDMNFALDRAEHAWNKRLGVWAEYGERFLLAYEYRLLIKLAEKIPDEGPAALVDKAFYRNCIDLRNMRDVGIFGFVDVPPPYRLWVKSEDMEQARDDLGIA